MMLPHLRQHDLYKRFHLDEPWDSEHNKKLLEKMPEIFGPKDTQAYKDHDAHPGVRRPGNGIRAAGQPTARWCRR